MLHRMIGGPYHGTTIELYGMYGRYVIFPLDAVLADKWRERKPRRKPRFCPSAVYEWTDSTMTTLKWKGVNAA